MNIWTVQVVVRAPEIVDRVQATEMVESLIDCATEAVRTGMVSSSQNMRDSKFYVENLAEWEGL